MNIRIASSLDRDHIKKVHLSAFHKSESETVSKLAIDLLCEQDTTQTLSLVAEIDDLIVGHIAFSSMVIENNETFQGYILAPLGVKPEFQKRQIGSRLIEYGIQKLSEKSVNAIFVYGDPEYYARFGFNTAAAYRYSVPYKLQYPFGWQAIILNEVENDKTPAVLTCVTPLCHPKLW